MPSAGPTSALRLVSPRGRLITRRPAVLLLGLLARVGLLRALCIWPDEKAPLLIVDARERTGSTWMGETFGLASERRLRLDAATINVLRSRALILGPSPTPLLAAVERALGRSLDRPRTAFHATGGAHPKVLCFVFEADAPVPMSVAKALTHESETEGIEREVALLEAVRERLRDTPLAADLPPQALWSGSEGGNPLVVEPVDPIAVTTGQVSWPDALEWLRRFQEATTECVEPWSDRDTADVVATTRSAWGQIEPGGAPELCAAVERAGREVTGVPVPRVGVHGDYWRGNLAGEPGAMRVFDWEFADFGQLPFFDVWTWELADLRAAAHRGDALDFDAAIAAATARVEDALETLGLDRRFARLSLPPSIGHLTFRLKLERGYETGNEASSAIVMRAVERFVTQGP